jgi:maltose alpha-D-glucosyltransferase/alpha-amylase
MDSAASWYKDAIFYELHVRAFQDSNADGIGDFPGLISRLDYLASLGVDAIWLLPFYSSPLKDDGYDIADYYQINPDYGTIEDFQRLIGAAHQRGIRIIADLVMNHTSDQHPWFQEARRDPHSPYRDYYVWSDTPDRYPGARIIFTDTESSNWAWDSLAGQYYWHRFFSSQPDLNFDNPRVQAEMMDVIRYWLSLGLDGFRVDAVPYLFEREGTNCENLPETHAYLAQLRAMVEREFPGALLLAEANQWPADVVRYFGTPEQPEFQMCFNFPVMPRIFMSLRRENVLPIVEIIGQTPEISPDCQWAIFLRNHDELTLEMVTDAERDYMYTEYAKDRHMKINVGIRRRLAPLLDGARRRQELLTATLLTLPGSPILYYGDEIGMGDNIFLGDRNGVRTPMQWSSDRNAGFSRADFERLYLPVIMDPIYGYQSVNVEAQERSQSSLLNWTRRMIAVRKRYLAFSRGDITFLPTGNPSVLAFLRSWGDQVLCIIANFSRFSQPAEIDLASHAGQQLIELIGNIPFPQIGQLPYFLSLGPHSFYWFRLEPAPRPPS